MITGSLPGACYAAGMTSFLNAKNIRILDYAHFAEPVRERSREGAQALAAEHGVEIQHSSQAHVRKEDVVAAVIRQRGDHPVGRSNSPTFGHFKIPHPEGRVTEQ
jgi:hypothetical protein